MTRRERKAARKLIQQPYKYATRYRRDAFSLLGVMADYRNAPHTNGVERWWACGLATQARTYNAEAKATGFYLP